MKKQILLALFFSFTYLGLNAQCNIPFAPALTCSSASVICDLDGYCTTTSGGNATDQPSTFCGSVQNNQWFAFVAGSANITLDFIVTTCTGTGSGTGLQAQVYSVCGAPWTSASNCLYEVSPNSTETLTMTNLTVGNVYYLMTDGFSGDICDYTIEVASGSTTPPIPNPAGAISGDPTFCPGASSVTYCASPSFGAAFYEWTIPPGASIVGADDGECITIDFSGYIGGNGSTGTITVTPTNGCESGLPSSFTVTQDPSPNGLVFTALADVCITEGVQSGLGGGTPTGGVYGGSGVTDDGNGMTYSFDPAVAGVGTHTITYTFTAAGCMGAASDDVEVFAAPVVTFTALADLFISANTQSGLGGGTPTGGVYSGPGVTDDGNGMTYSFDPVAAGVGTHTLTYSFSNTNGCTESVSDDVEVLEVNFAISRVDEDGDGISDITDPCDCNDPMNIAANSMLYYHDFITVTSNPNEMWEVTAITSGAMHELPIPSPLIAPVQFMDVGPGVLLGQRIYRLDFWTLSGEGFAVEVNREVNPLPMPLTIGGTCSDVDPPVITSMCPGDITIECGDPIPTPPVLMATDGCGFPEGGNMSNLGLNYDPIAIMAADNFVAGACGNTGVITRTWTATDAAGNPTVCTQTITIEDNLVPTVVCQNISIDLDGNGNATITPDQIDNGSSDNCGTVTLSLSQTDFTCGDIGDNPVTLTIIDDCGNSASCTSIVTIADNLPPVLICPADQTIHLNPGACRATLSYEPVSATDNCGVVDTVMTPTSGSDFEIGTTTVTMTISDAVGNTSTCSYSVTVVEYVPTSFEMTCNSLVNVSLDENCEALVTADMILEGNNYGCYEDYMITVIDTAGNIVINNLLGLDEVGTTLTVSITDPETGNTCWGEIYVEDKLIPTFDCPANLNVTCNGATDPSITGEPTLTSCEISVTIEFEDEYTDYDCTGDPNDSSVRARILRTWTVTDESGNSDQCVQNINILKPELVDVIFPTDKDEINGTALDCGAVAANPTLTHPNFTGYPQYVNQNVTPGGLCAFSIGYQDLELEICAGGSSYEIIRTWTVRNMCEPLVPGINPIQHLQSIKVLDTTGPSLTCPASMTLVPGNNSCEVSVILPSAIISDDCSGFEVYVETPNGNIYTNGGAIAGLYSLGNHTVTYYATDACGNISSCDYTFSVEDLTEPIAVCDAHTIAALGTDGTLTIDAATFDDGSYDGCSAVTFDVRKMTDGCGIPENLSFGSSVSFCCAEVNTTVIVELRVTDEAGNINSCMVEVEVQDKIDPTIICPSDQDVECSETYLDYIIVGQPLPTAAIAANGEAIAIDNCQGVSVTNIVSANTVACGNGIITIVWTAIDEGGRTSSCIQNYVVTDGLPFVGNDITWPLDYTASTCGTGLEPTDLSSPYNYPVVDEGACNNVAIGHQDQVLGFGAADACLKILRKWYVIDWCQASANQDPTVPGSGVWHYTQVIKVINSNDPNVTVVDFPSIIDNYESDCGNAFAAFEITVDDDCTPQADIEVTWEFSTGLTGSGLSASGAFPNGSYALTFTVSDLCGNTVWETHNFTVKDAKKPTPVCIFGIATTVMPSSGSVSISAADFESGSSFDNCTAYDDLVFSFSQNVNEVDLVITCDDVPANGLVPVTLYVTDESGNFDFCSTFIDVQDPNFVCPNPAALITGTIENEFQEVIEEVTVTLSDDNGMNIPVITGPTGVFQFNQTYGDYEVTPEKDINYLNGVTTYDLVLISKHILGIELLDSPYKIIAADANNSQSITALDLVKIRALILHLEDEFTNNTSWRFVDQGYVFPNPVNPWQEDFPEYIGLTSTAVPANFTALKVGDVNGTASPNSLLGSDTRTFSGNLALSVETREVAAGESFTVDFKAYDFKNISGYQFTLGFDKSSVEFVDVTSSLTGLDSKNFGLTKLSEGIITTSWNSNEGVTVANNEVLFSISFVANQALNTEELLSINSRYTEAEAYSNSDLLDVVLEFNGNTVSNGFELYQNTPNPFKAETMIGFSLAEAGAATLKVYDVAGKVLRLIKVDATKGYNEVRIDRQGLYSTGILYYQLETAQHTATKKMILAE